MPATKHTEEVEAPARIAPQSRLRWYAVRFDTARHADKATAKIKLLGVPVFSPRAYRQERQGKWLVAVDDGPLFPGFLFIAMRAPGPWKSRASILWGAVSDIAGVVQIMGNRARDGEYRPMPIRYKEMRKIRTKDRAGERRAAAERFKPGQGVRITGGTFGGFDGIFDKPVKDRVRILVQLFGREVGVEIEEAEVRAA